MASYKAPPPPPPTGSDEIVGRGKSAQKDKDQGNPGLFQPKHVPDLKRRGHHGGEEGIKETWKTLHYATPLASDI